MSLTECSLLLMTEVLVPWSGLLRAIGNKLPSWVVTLVAQDSGENFFPSFPTVLSLRFISPFILKFLKTVHSMIGRIMPPTLQIHVHMPIPDPVCMGGSPSFFQEEEWENQILGDVLWERLRQPLTALKEYCYHFCFGQSIFTAAQALI